MRYLAILLLFVFVGCSSTQKEREPSSVRAQSDEASQRAQMHQTPISSPYPGSY